MTCFISDLTSDNYLALPLSFYMSLSLALTFRDMLWMSLALFVEDSSNHALMLMVLWVVKKTKMLAFAL